MFLRGQPVQGFSFTLYDIMTGAPVNTGTPDGYISMDGQSLVPLGPAQAEGNGQWSVDLPALDADYVGLLLEMPGAYTAFASIATWNQEVPPYKKNAPARVYFGLLHKSTGLPITGGTVSGFVTPDGGTQVPLPGTVEPLGHGLWTKEFTPTGNNNGLTFTHDDSLNLFLTINAWIDAEINATQESLASISQANLYFLSRLHTGPWDNASDNDRVKALRQATRAIKCLNFKCEFPAEPAMIACCEEALSLLDGKSPEEEYENLSVISQGYSSVRSTYDRSFVHEYLNVGITSSIAWRYIRPYLNPGRTIKISRV